MPKSGYANFVSNATTSHQVTIKWAPPAYPGSCFQIVVWWSMCSHILSLDTTWISPRGCILRLGGWWPLPLPSCSWWIPVWLRRIWKGCGTPWSSCLSWCRRLLLLDWFLMEPWSRSVSFLPIARIQCFLFFHMKSIYRIQGGTYSDDALISPGTLLFVYDNIL